MPPGQREAQQVSTMHSLLPVQRGLTMRASTVAADAGRAPSPAAGAAADAAAALLDDPAAAVAAARRDAVPGRSPRGVKGRASSPRNSRTARSAEEDMTRGNLRRV